MSNEKEIIKLATWLTDDLDPLLNHDLAMKVTRLVINYGYKQES